MRPKYYDIIARAVEEGINFGVNRAYKHTPAPAPGLANLENLENVKEAIRQEVMNSICEVFIFED